jgi:hypothetical protein
LAVGNSPCAAEEERGDGDGFGLACAASLRFARETTADRFELLSAAGWGRGCVTATSEAGIGLASPDDVVSIVTASDPSPRFRKA